MKEVIEKLNEGLKDESYRQIWIANIAMSQLDNERWYREKHNKVGKYLSYEDRHTIANLGAKHFLFCLAGGINKAMEDNIFKFEEHTVDLKRYDKTDLEHDLDKFFGKEDEESKVYSDIARTYNEAMFEHGSPNIKVRTNLVPPQIYKIAAEEIEIVKE